MVCKVSINNSLRCSCRAQFKNLILFEERYLKKDHPQYSMDTIRCKNYVLHLNCTLIMGILNVTPDSFSDGGNFFSPEKAIAHAKQMAEEGADIIDIGGESTRPGSEPISVEEELRRVIPIIEVLLHEVKIPLSIDTMKPEVAEECLKRGVHMLNDVTGLRNPKMVKIAAKYGVPTIIMHMQGERKTMQENPHYDEVADNIKSYLQAQAEQATKAGISQIIIDPGIGFGKTVGHNLLLLKNLSKFKELGFPVLIGPSRKSYLGKILGSEVDDRLEGTLAAVTVCVLNGADIIRVHDVKECKKAVVVAGAITKA